MKKFLLIPVAALTFVACTSETIEFTDDAQQTREIAFAPIAQKATRGANAILDGVFPQDNTMEVVAYQSAPNAENYFAQTTFSFVDDDADVWHASPAKYWPLSAATLNFFAVSGYGVNTNAITIANDLATAQVRYTAANGYSKTTQSDIMYAFNRGAVVQSGNDLTFNGGTTVAASKVDMVFKHALSQINFQVKAADAASTAITINNITLTGAKYTGILDLTNTGATATSGDVTTAIAWTADAAEDRTVPNVPASLTTTYAPVAPSTACLMIIPNATSAFTSFTINYTFDGHTYDYTYTPTSTITAAGYKYTYQINFRLHEITINPRVTPWEDSSTEINIF